MSGPGLIVPDGVLVESYQRLRSVHKVGAEVGLNFANVAVRLNRLGVQMRNQGKRGQTGRRDGLPIQQHEKHFTQKVVTLAKLYGWTLVYHTFWSEHSAAGFPDLILVRVGADGVGRCIAAELKVNTVVKPAQRAWLDGLGSVPGIEAYVWRPADMDEIVRALQERR